MTRFTAQRLPVYAALAASGLIAGLALGRVEPIALSAPFVLALLAIVTAREPQITARLSLDRDRAIEGEDVTAFIDLAATGGNARLELLVPLPAQLSSPHNAARALLLRDGEPQRVELALRCERWGAVLVGPLLIRVRSPLGMRSWEAQVGGRHSLRIYPTEETLRSLVPALDTQVFAGNQISRARGEGIEFADLREWQPGDRIRRVNWRATALRGSLWVNEQHLERNTDVVLFLDTFAEVRELARTTHLRAVRAAASLAHGYLQRKDRVGLVGFGAFVSWFPPQLGMRQLYTIVDHLLTSEIAESYTRPGVSLLPPRTLPPKALVIALTPLFDNRIARALLDLRGRGYDLVVIEIATPEAAEPGDDASAPLAERLWRLSREALRWQFAEVGVPVVTWREGEPLAVPIEEVNSSRHLARPA
ncbi:MAG: hypothetical protein QOG85_2184 [Gaiellaceae bacterium]|nr:hypothetical protein [Gaiellaceae bacterium]